MSRLQDTRVIRTMSKTDCKSWGLNCSADNGDIVVNSVWPRAPIDIIDSFEIAYMNESVPCFSLAKCARIKRDIEYRECGAVCFVETTYARFVSAEAKAEATVERPEPTPFTFRPQMIARGVTMLPPEVDLSAQQPVEAQWRLQHGSAFGKQVVHTSADGRTKELGCGCRTLDGALFYACPDGMQMINEAAAKVGPPMSVTVPLPVETEPRFGVGKEVGNIISDHRPFREVVDDMIIGCERIIVATQKADELDAAMAKECRAAIAKLREWPRCNIGDHTLKIAKAHRLDAEGQVAVYLVCDHSIMHAATIQLSPATHRMLGAASLWEAP